MVWQFISVYIINRTLHGRLEEKFLIPVRPCNIFYLYVLFLSIYMKNDKSCYLIVFLISAITPCLPLNPCENNGTCSLVTSTSFSCNCSQDYEGITCQTSKYFNILSFTLRILLEVLILKISIKDSKQRGVARNFPQFSKSTITRL